MATKTTKTTKATKSKTTKTTKAIRVKKQVIDDIVPKKSVKIKKIGEDKFKGMCIVYKDGDVVKPCFIDGIADYIEQWYQDNKYKYEVLDKVDTRIFSSEERMNGVMDKEFDTFISKILNVMKKHK